MTRYEHSWDRSVVYRIEPTRDDRARGAALRTTLPDADLMAAGADWLVDNCGGISAHSASCFAAESKPSTSNSTQQLV